jgi:hypothetical protein
VRNGKKTIQKKQSKKYRKKEFRKTIPEKPQKSLRKASEKPRKKSPGNILNLSATG